ncbi:YdcH family protein [Rhizorhabdus argentea]|uniref:YdcH family protein n=1 Tax=Rhizorhabdus argentea TaxID=1387174 RepID=UPI0030EF9E53
MLTTHSSAMLAKHAGIEARIAAESQRPAPDTVLISELKKQKLRIKEALARL